MGWAHVAGVADHLAEETGIGT